MDIFVNKEIQRKEVIRIFGTRTLVLANNTNQNGKYFKNVRISVLRRGYTSSVSIRNWKKDDELITNGIFLGENAKGLEGIKFQGRTIRKGKMHNLFYCTSEGKILEKGIIWGMTPNGWTILEEGEKMKGHYEIQIWLSIGKTHWGWVSMTRSEGIVYTYETEEEARRMLEMCYPNKIYGTEVRITFVEDEI
jgi:hypothetical protein